MPDPALSTHEKALKINLDPGKYGAFAEIGAGQEVARWFFRVGGAAGTVAKTISAYDMVVSDAIYGACERYVSRQRLHTMLAHEYELHQERLGPRRGGTTRFFVFANTVAARSYLRAEEGHGWMGIRFQVRPQAPAADIVIHVHMRDRENVQQQEALGIVGVNLIYAALYLHAHPQQLLASLKDNLAPGRVEVDMVKFSGPDFAGVDNRLMALRLVEEGLTHAAMFTADGEVVHAAEVLHKQPILVQRGSFRPVTRATVNMLDCACTHFSREPRVQEQSFVVLLEMTLRHLATGRGIEPGDFLDRVDLLGTLGRTVLISDFAEYHRLAAYLSRSTRKMVGIALGARKLEGLFAESQYAELEGGILESFGRLFKNDLKLYVYPYLDAATERLVGIDEVAVPGHLRHLWAHLRENRLVEGLENVDSSCLPVFAREVLARIGRGDPSWEPMVPAQVAQAIRARRLFGYRP